MAIFYSVSKRALSSQELKAGYFAEELIQISVPVSSRDIRPASSRETVARSRLTKGVRSAAVKVRESCWMLPGWNAENQRSKCSRNRSFQPVPADRSE
ncbi:hypothetical protein FHS13_002520 [Nocardiopsis algeriensis]|uniref:Uncharacterized protein n=1 Tax=Nocardiopsis algeriensis TaxID=1478215 RepID=A0A841IPH2_9ACTN|nr:hypothetical protein [Nocardiopsis algeriensis]